MKSTENYVKSESNYFINNVSNLGKMAYLYPTYIGCFYYNAGYKIERDTYHSFLLINIKSGTMKFLIGGKEFYAKENQVVILNTYEYHKYEAVTDVKIEWFHFDGINAMAYYNIIASNDVVFDVSENYVINFKIHAMVSCFEKQNIPDEVLLSKYIVEILTELVLISKKENNLRNRIEESKTYIYQNLSKNINIVEIAEKVSLSKYYFLRLFKKEMHITPYQFILNERINYSKYLLKNTNHTIKEICFLCGFNDESTYCTSFKKIERISPSQYKKS